MKPRLTETALDSTDKSGSAAGSAALIGLEAIDRPGWTVD